MMTTPNMPPCNVFPCGRDGSAVIQNEIDWDPIEAVVCTEHKAAIDEGEPWDWENGRVMVGQMLAPRYTGWEIRDSQGSRGVTLTLVTDPPYQKPFTMFLTPEGADDLVKLLQKRGTKGNS